MKRSFSLALILAAGLLGACSDNDAPVSNATDTVFEDFLFDVVTDVADAEPRSIEDQSFTFARNDAAFAALFPAD